MLSVENRKNEAPPFAGVIGIFSVEALVASKPIETGRFSPNLRSPQSKLLWRQQRVLGYLMLIWSNDAIGRRWSYFLMALGCAAANLFLFTQIGTVSGLLWFAPIAANRKTNPPSPLGPPRHVFRAPRKRRTDSRELAGDFRISPCGNSPGVEDPARRQATAPARRRAGRDRQHSVS
jgi:hypothetical protein